MRHIIVSFLIVFLLVGCTNINSSDLPNTGNQATEMFAFNKEVMLDIDNVNVVFYPGVSTNYAFMFNLIIDQSVSKENLEIRFNNNLNLSYDIYDSELITVDYKDFLISNTFDWIKFKEGYMSSDQDVQSKAHNEFNSLEDEYEKFLNNITDTPNVYQVYVNFSEPNIGDTLTTINIKIEGKEYSFDIGEIAFLEYKQIEAEGLQGPFSGTIGRKTIAKNNKLFIDDTGSYVYDFSSDTDIILSEVKAEDKTPPIQTLSLKLLRNGLESTIVFDSPSNLNFQILKGDSFSLIPTYKYENSNREITYAQTYNSSVVFEKEGNKYNYLMESGIINTEHTLATLLSTNESAYQTYYFDFLEVIEAFDRQ